MVLQYHMFVKIEVHFEDDQYLLWIKCLQTATTTVGHIAARSTEDCFIIPVITKPALVSVQVRLYSVPHYIARYDRDYSLFPAGINMCLTTADCVASASCINIAEMPGFLCQCPAGYTGDGRTSGEGCDGS